jgi:hypothetical protein
VAPGAGDRLKYTDDFDDDWTHEIVVAPPGADGVTDSTG